MTSSRLNPDPFYPAHVATLRGRWDAALQAGGVDTAVIGAGPEVFHHRDDLPYPYETSPWFAQWLPLLEHPDSVIIYHAGETPRLLIHRPTDYWHKPPPLPPENIAKLFCVEEFGTLDGLRKPLQKLADRTVWIGDPKQWSGFPVAGQCNPPVILNHLEYFRAVKTDYEIQCIEAATERAMPAHRAAKDAFQRGNSEYAILMAFLTTCQQTENELPYPAIIACNEAAAVLHYQHYRKNLVPAGSLLIDAGCRFNGYACDISRTYVRDDEEFQALVRDLDKIQQTVANLVRPGLNFVDLHSAAHHAIAELLNQHQLVTGEPEELVSRQITGYFFPHGLGHYLGLQVHDVGGKISDPDGRVATTPGEYPHIRLTRTLEENQVVTIEPGIYFIDRLLSQLRKSDASPRVNWKKIDRLRKFGGVRIEDNVRVVQSGCDNITRRIFSSARS